MSVARLLPLNSENVSGEPSPGGGAQVPDPDLSSGRRGRVQELLGVLVRPQPTSILTRRPSCSRFSRCIYCLLRYFFSKDLYSEESSSVTQTCHDLTQNCLNLTQNCLNLTRNCNSERHCRPRSRVLARGSCWMDTLSRHDRGWDSIRTFTPDLSQLNPKLYPRHDRGSRWEDLRLR